MKRIAFFDTKPYDKTFFNLLNNGEYKIKYFESKLNSDTVSLASEYDGIVAFVNDSIDKDVILQMEKMNIGVLALRCAGYNNVDFKTAYNRIRILRVPAYSPYAVAEHAMALLLALSRKTHKAYNRTREHNFSLAGLTGFNLHGKTIGVIGTGKIGQIMIDICKGFGMNVVAYDPFPAQNSGINYVSLQQLFAQSDIISLHCPLTKDTMHIINKESLATMKNGVYIINTSRGALIESRALLSALMEKKVAGAGLDVYEEEENFFFEDFSNEIVQDEVLSLLVSLPSVIVTSHQAFLTNEALENIAQTTLDNLGDYFNARPLKNEICYQCDTKAPGTFCSQSSPLCKFK